MNISSRMDEWMNGSKSELISEQKFQHGYVWINRGGVSMQTMVQNVNKNIHVAPTSFDTKLQTKWRPGRGRLSVRTSSPEDKCKQLVARVLFIKTYSVTHRWRIFESTHSIQATVCDRRPYLIINHFNFKSLLLVFNVWCN